MEQFEDKELYERLADLFTLCKNLHETGYAMLKQLQALYQHDGTVEEKADIAFVTKRCSERVKDLRVEIDRINHVMQLTAAATYIKEGRAESAAKELIRSKYCSSRPEVKMVAPIPKLEKDEEKFVDFCASFGIPSEIALKDVFRPHWPKMVDLIAEMVAEGKKLPGGVDPSAMWPQYSLRIHTRKGLNLEEELEKVLKNGKERSSSS